VLNPKYVDKHHPKQNKLFLFGVADNVRRRREMEFMGFYLVLNDHDKFGEMVQFNGKKIGPL
jgi:hypothetical protein